MVALEGHAVRYPAEILDDPTRFAAAFRQYLIDNREIFENQPDMYLAGRRSALVRTGAHILDRDKALRIARATQQVAIYDVSTGEYVRMGDDDDSR